MSDGFAPENHTLGDFNGVQIPIINRDQLYVEDNIVNYDESSGRMQQRTHTLAPLQTNLICASFRLTVTSSRLFVEAGLAKTVKLRAANLLRTQAKEQ